ncbi:tetratricopeptide repeat protein [Ramlibacter sp.]|uniref:tetratricopeptide repeat protein n=1 Tax=Ramlibacter sp. TaxID=1917967 RepID=UPI0035B24689
MDPSARIDDAWARFAAGDRAAAIAIARQAARDESDPMAAAALGFFLYDAGELDEAAAVLRPALARWPVQAALHWYLGWVLHRQGDRQGAAASLRRACELDPSLDEAAFSLAWLLHDLGQTVEARAWAGQALRARRTVPRLLQSGWLEQASGRFGAAAGFYREALAQRPEDASVAARLSLHLSQCLVHLGRAAEGLRTLEAALDRLPADADLLLAYGVALREHGRTVTAKRVARRLTAVAPDDARGWDLLAQVHEAQGDAAAAAAAIERSLALQPAQAGHWWRLAEFRRRAGQTDEAMQLVDQALQADPDHPAASELRVHLLLERRDHEAARRSLLPLLRRAPAQPEALRLLAVAASLRGRRRAARRWLLRSTGLASDRIETWRTLAWTEAELGHLQAAADAVRHLLTLAPEDTAARIQGALILARCGDVPAAERLAERLLAEGPRQPDAWRADAWRALAEVRYFQRRWGEARWAIEQALALQPDAAQHWRRLAWIHMEQGDFAEARAACEQARACQPDQPDILIERAELGLRAGEGRAALALLEGAPAEVHAARLLRARLLTEGGVDDEGDGAAAVALCRELLARAPDDAAVLQIVSRAVALGHPGAAALLDAADRPARLAALRQAMANAVHLHAHADMARLCDYAREREPEESWLQCAALYFAWMSARSTPIGLALQARDWSRGMTSEASRARAAAGAQGQLTLPSRGSRPRLAYLATQPHQSLLRRVLAAHAQAEIDILLFSDEHWPDLPSNVQLRRIDLERLPAICAANGIEIVIDTGGLHPLGSLAPDLGQFGLLRVLGRRIATCQVGWLGTWGTSGGLFDVLLADRWSVPQDHRGWYTETVEWLEGGQWCWEPPLEPPPVNRLPALDAGEVTFGVIARHVRLNDESVQAMAQVMQRLPRSRLLCLGRLGHDWPARRSLLALLARAGIAAGRVDFEPHRNHTRFLESLQRVDVVLDTFPGSGGLSLLDAFWMGVPVVTLAGQWSGARQGASLVSTVGHAEWVAETVEGYVETAVGLTRDLPRLAALREGLREQVRASPLLDGTRIARQIEALARRLRTRS